MINEALVDERIQSIRDRIESHGRRDVCLIAVTKGFGVEAMVAAIRSGCTDVGENYAQELIAKMAAYPADLERPTVHFIGRLQSNKVRSVASHVDCWQTVDRSTLVDEIARRAPGARILVQVNATDEDDKGGCRPSEVEGLVTRSVAAGLEPIGLMTVGPTDGDPFRTRRAFETVAHMASTLGLSELSMGMSADLDIALEVGSTMVRVGSAIFGDRPPVT